MSSQFVFESGSKPVSVSFGYMHVGWLVAGKASWKEDIIIWWGFWHVEIAGCLFHLHMNYKLSLHIFYEVFLHRRELTEKGIRPVYIQYCPLTDCWKLQIIILHLPRWVDVCFFRTSRYFNSNSCLLLNIFRLFPRRGMQQWPDRGARGICWGGSGATNSRLLSSSRHWSPASIGKTFY